MTQLDLPSDKVERLFNRDFLEFVRLVEGKFPDLASYPPPAQLGLLDMAFSMGTWRMMNLFTQFSGAVKVRNWKKAAEGSSRGKVGSTRNDKIRGLFAKAADDEPFFLDPLCPRKPASPAMLHAP